MSGQKKLAWIDFLRAVAILMVIGDHTALHFKGISKVLGMIFAFGMAGVQLFFVVSAITLCISSESRKEESHPTINFYARRFFRIAPLYYWGIFFYAMYSAVNNYFLTDKFVPATQYTFLNIFSNVTFIHGFFSSGNNNIVPGGWSIGTEMAFYSIFPLLWVIQSRLSQRKIWILPTLTFLFTFSVLITYHILTGSGVSNDSFLYYNLINQLNVFVLGIVGYRLLKHNTPSKWLCLLIYFGVYYLSCVDRKWHSPVAFYFAPLLSGIYFVGLCLFFSQIRGHKIINFLAPIGKVSFSMYLFHFVVLDLVLVLFDRFHVLERTKENVGLVIVYLLTVALTFVIAKASYAIIEKPGIIFGGKFMSRILNGKWINAQSTTANS